MQAIEYLRSLLCPVVSSFGHEWPDNANIEPPKDKKFGDLASNCALVLAKKIGMNPRELAEKIAEQLKSSSPDIAEVSIAGPGFINVRFVPTYWHKKIIEVEEKGDTFGAGAKRSNERVQIEYVSANPTGPLHIGHGRGAAIGDSMARIMRFAGYNVETEYYLNDAGRQMRTLGRSIWLRALEIEEKSSEPFPDDAYKGSYILDIAKELLNEKPSLTSLPEDEGIDLCYKKGMNVILGGIKEDLKEFKVHHDVWFSELSLTETGKVSKALDSLKQKGSAYEKDGALWFETTPLGDDKDRVLCKSDGSLTYFASDIAYHTDKYQRGFTHVIDVWGADHHGYIPRMRAAISAIGQEQKAFDVILVQLVNLLKDGEQIAMSTRAGQFETLHDVVQEVGADAARFIFLSRKSDSKLDFDLSLVKQRTMENPVYYVQYAHARVCALVRRAKERGITSFEASDFSLLVANEELDIIKMLDRFPLLVSDASEHLAPHYISYYLMELAGLMHKYYSSYQVLGGTEEPLAMARLRLLIASGQVLKNGLSLLGVTAPDTM